MSVSEKVLDAIELLATNSVDKAGYDRTIQAQIVSCEDATIGKYRCRYQDAIIYAYANNSDMTFNNGAYVYILVPGNDMKKEKTILGTTKKLGINYISQAQGDQAYDIIGNNCVTSSNKFYLDSNNKDYTYVIYQYGKSSSVTLDVTSLNQYIKQSSSLILGAVFKTSIPPERQLRGHYGITYNLRFLDNANNEVIRSYTIDEDSMVDNPYRLAYETRQYQIFDIDGSNFIRVESIQIFSKDFPEATGTITGRPLSSGDIEITVLEISGAVRMSENEIGGVAITFYTPQGTFFTNDSTSASYKTITAQVRIKGKLASAAQNIPFYWGSENVGITARSEYYNKYLGRGWKCLNDKNIVQPGTNTTDPVIEWIPSKDTYILKFDDATARDNKFKVAIVYDGNVITKTINIQNLSSNVPNLTIESDGGTKFYYDIGHPTLTCKVNGGEPAGYKYYWAYESDTGVFSELPETTEENRQYQKAANTLNDLKDDLVNGTKFANAEAENLENAETAIEAYNFIQRVSGNKVYDVQISSITSFGTFKCSVYNNKDVYLGTASITLTNTLDGEDLYSLVINNGSAVFQYNENGVAPNNRSLDVQQQISELNFTIYDNLGQPIDSNIIKNSRDCKIRWQFPIKDTMLEDQSQNGNNAGTDAAQTYRYYDNKTSLIYGIAQRYDVKKQRNQIKLTVDYKGMNLTAETDFTFAKQGEPGTNGTEYLVKLVPNTRMDNPPLWAMVTKAGSRYLINYGLNTKADEFEIGTTSRQLFKAQLWHSGELVWEGFSASTAAKDGVTKPTAVHWEILSNKYNALVSDDSAFRVANASSGYIQYLGDNLRDYIGTPLANIIKCSITWEGKLYYGTIPIITAWTVDDSYRVGLKDFTGFRYVIYTSDGMSPQYDNSHPFEFICQEKIHGIWQDISIVAGSHSVDYTPITVGNYHLTGEDGSTRNSNLLEILTSSVYRKDCQKNQWRIRPSSRYDGICVNEAVCCTYRQNGRIVGRINIPIHFLLNKYGMANINEWDGNSVQLDSEGGFILAPQMGAGQKESDNSFTGVLMGETRVPGKNNPEVGLLGYNHGARSFFLNSKNGSAIFGKTNQGQIIIDPSQDDKNAKAMLYSGNFWRQYNQDGLPTNYNYKNKNYKPSGNAKGEGLLIDLTTPEIYFGTGNFYVTKEGYIHAASGGDLGGWKMGVEEDENKIKHSALFSNIAKNKGRITLDAGVYAETLDEEGNVIKSETTGPGKIYSHSHDELIKTGDGFYLSYDGLSIGNKVKISNKGVMYLGSNAVANGGVADTEGKVLNRNYWEIGGDDNKRSYISFGGSKSFSDATNSDSVENTAKVYLGTDGISLGQRFSVNQNGELKAYNGAIGGWKIDTKTISAGSGNNQLILNSSGEITGGNYSSDNKTGWKISRDGSVNFYKGKIGGWTINSSTLTGSDGQGHSLTLNSNGSMSGPSWSISTDGTAYFKKVYGSVAPGLSLSGYGFSLGGNGAGSSLSPGSIGMSGDSGIGNVGSLGGGLYQAYKDHFDYIYATKAQFGEVQADIITVKNRLNAVNASINNLDIMSKLNFNGNYANWDWVVGGITKFSITKTGYNIQFYYEPAICAPSQHDPAQFAGNI